METLAPYTEFGVKGLGEGGAIAPPAAIGNAVNDALRPLGAEVLRSPMTPRRVLEAIAAAKREKAPAAFEEARRVKPVNFDYVRPPDVEASLSLLAEDGRSVKVVAGSQSLGPMLNMRLVQPDLLVDITGIEELRQVKEDADGVVIGACVTHADIEDGRAPDVTGGALPSVAHGIAYRAVRNRGTIGGSLTHADPSADWISILAALGAS